MHLTSRSEHFPDLVAMLVRLPTLQGTLLGHVTATSFGVSKAPIMLFVPAGDDTVVTFTYIHDLYLIFHALNAWSMRTLNTREEHQAKTQFKYLYEQGMSYSPHRALDVRLASPFYR